MKLLDLLNEVEVDEDDFRTGVYAVMDGMFVASLKEYRQRKIDEYEICMNGGALNIYVFGKPEEDAFEISRRIEAVDMLLSEYSVEHHPYDFAVWDGYEEEDDEDGSN